MVHRRLRALPLLTAVVLAGALVGLLPRPAAAQGAEPTAAGAAGGFMAGGFVAVGILATRAEMGHYAWNVPDALRWAVPSMALGMAGGAALGATDTDRLAGAGLGALGGAAVGAGVGLLLTRGAATPEDRWTGAVIGGAAGLLAGAVLGALLRDGGGSATPGGVATSAVGTSIPVALPFHRPGGR